MQTPFPISCYDSTMAPPSIIEKLKMQSPYYNFSEIGSQACLQGLPSLLKCPKYLLEDFKKYISQFSLKYLGDDSQEIVEQILLKGSRLDMEIQGRKGMRQLAAAIVLGEFSDKIRIRIKEYAALNNLFCKTLTKNYIKYQNLKKYQSSSNGSSSEQVKVIEQDSFPQITCKLSQVTCKLELIQEEKTHLQKREKAEVESVKQAIQFIYDKIFRSSKMQENRRQIINKMNEKIYEIIYDIDYHLQIGKKSPSRLFAIVFTFIRSMGISYPLAKFNEGIKFAAGHTVKYEEVLKVKTACSLSCKKKSPINFQIKLQDDSNNFLFMQNNFFQ